jgi:putative tryptophan/tyrosine transport system substrate-binding protein
VKGKVDVIFAAGEVAIRAAQQATKIIPIIGVADDMVGSGPIAKLDALQEAARGRNIEISICRVAGAEEITAAIDMAKASGAEALNVLASAVLYMNRQLIMDRVAALRLPAIYQWPENAEEGGFAAYGPRICA